MWDVGDEIRQGIKGKDTIEISGGDAIVPQALKRDSEFDRMQTFVEEGIVVALDGGPMEVIARQAIQAAGKLRDSRDRDVGRRSPRHCSEGRVGDRRISGSKGETALRDDTVDSEANRVHKSGAEALCVFERQNLTPRSKADAFIVQLIRLIDVGQVDQIRASQCVLLAEMVIDPGGEEVLVCDLLTREDIEANVAARENGSIRCGVKGLRKSDGGWIGGNGPGGQVSRQSGVREDVLLLRHS